MTREELRHLIRAACKATEEQQVIVVGSQAILATWKEIAAPERVTMSNEADIAFFVDPEELKADTVMGVLGLDSQFHETFGIYADGVTIDSPILAPGWVERLIPLTSDDHDEVFVGWCLESHDLCASKIAAGRPKDHEFVESLVRAGLIDPDRVAVLLGQMAVHDMVREDARRLLSHWKSDGWDEASRHRLEARRADALRDRKAQCPYPSPPHVEYPPRCGAPTHDGPCRQVRGHCSAHPS